MVLEIQIVLTKLVSQQIENIYNLRKGFAMTVSPAGKKFERKYFNANLAAAFYFYEFSVFEIET